jgi:hypothetical protein
MICDHAAKCGDNGKGCPAHKPHTCARSHIKPVYCRVVDSNVVCVKCNVRKPRSYDAEGRAARREAVRLARLANRQLRSSNENRKISAYWLGINDASLEILRAMREARKGEK